MRGVFRWIGSGRLSRSAPVVAPLSAIAAPPWAAWVEAALPYICSAKLRDRGQALLDEWLLAQLGACWPVTPDWVRVDEYAVPYDEHRRVLVYTEGVDFAGEQFFDVPALDFYHQEEGDDQVGTEVTRAATHWRDRPYPQPGGGKA